MKVIEATEVKQKIMHYARFERDHIAVVTEGLRNADVLGITRTQFATEFEIKVSRSDLNKELAAIKYADITMNQDRNLAPADSDPEQMELNIELGKLKNKSGGWTKISKHEEYTDPKKYFEKHRRYMYTQPFIPNYFYMVVPDKLVAYAVEQLAGTKYGVIAYDGCRQLDQHMGYFLDGIWYDRYGDRPEGAVWKRGAPCDGNCYKEVAVRKKAMRIHSEKIADHVIISMLTRTCTENIFLMKEIIWRDEKIKKLEEQTNGNNS